MNHKPVCVKCQKVMFPKKNEVDVLDLVNFSPRQLWEGDLWECPRCYTQIIIGFGCEPYMSCREVGFDERVAKLKAAGTLFKNEI